MQRSGHSRSPTLAQQRQVVCRRWCPHGDAGEMASKLGGYPRRRMTLGDPEESLTSNQPPYVSLRGALIAARKRRSTNGFGSMKKDGTAANRMRLNGTYQYAIAIAAP